MFTGWGGCEVVFLPYLSFIRWLRSKFHMPAPCPNFILQFHVSVAHPYPRIVFCHYVCFRVGCLFVWAKAQSTSHPATQRDMGAKAQPTGHSANQQDTHSQHSNRQATFLRAAPYHYQLHAQIHAGFTPAFFACQAVGWSIGRLFFTRAVPHCVPHLSNGDCYMLTGIRSSALPLIFHFPIIQSPRLTSSPLSPPAKAQNISQRSSIPRCTPVPPAKAQGSRVPFFSPPDQAKAKTTKTKTNGGNQ